jgi:hypothetical protein
MSKIHMRVVQGAELVADMPGWEGPVPRRGDYLFHPPQEGHPQFATGGPVHANVAGRVASVGWYIYRRPALAGEYGFVKADQPYVEITLES